MQNSIIPQTPFKDPKKSRKYSCDGILSGIKAISLFLTCYSGYIPKLHILLKHNIYRNTKEE